jgi:hypothetical protein
MLKTLQTLDKEVHLITSTLMIESGEVEKLGRKRQGAGSQAAVTGYSTMVAADSSASPQGRPEF